MPTVAKNIVYRPNKIIHQYQVLINAKKKGQYFSRVYSTLEEAVAGRDAYLESVKNEPTTIKN
jgi:hypothetical protein